jgi:hypothetical protein
MRTSLRHCCGSLPFVMLWTAPHRHVSATDVGVIWCETDEGGDLLAMLVHREGIAIESDSGIAETNAEC